jgi:ABC-type phosphate transport system substrate-binding protein
MKNYKSLLLAAVAASSMLCSAAYAQAVINTPMIGAELKGAGATAVESVVVEAFNCISGPTNDQDLGRGGNANATPTPQPSSFATIPSGNFVPTTPNTANPILNCATNGVQPNFVAKYVATGSGFGREIWRNFSNRFRQTTANPTGVVGASNQNPFVELSGQPEWTNVQFAFSEGPISASDLATYNTNANSATNKAGAAIQIPFYVVPVAFSYAAQYGVTAGGVPLNFQAPVGGIKMNQAQYCGVVNGTITNFKTLSNTLRDPADDLARWNADGVPIRLVGRLDSSGTTDIFTRHLAAVCTATPGNKFTGPAATLPIAAQGTARYINGVLTTGTEATGLFALSTGNSGVRDAVAAAPNVPTANGNGTLLNGKLGYNSGDFVVPANGAILQAAQLTQVGSLTAFKTATTTNATAAFGTILPPQTTANSGVYNPADPRKNSVTLALVNRANPLDWADVLYSKADLVGGFTGRTLAAPVAGYPITGVSFLLTSTCFKKDSDRFAMTTFIYGNTKKLNKNSTGLAGAPGNVSTSLFVGTSASLKGLTAQSNFAPLPAGWQRAIFETFLQSSTAAALVPISARGLWIQNKLPTTTLTGITRNTGGTDSNVGGTVGAGCTAGVGA